MRNECLSDSVSHQVKRLLPKSFYMTSPHFLYKKPDEFFIEIARPNVKQEVLNREDQLIAYWQLARIYDCM